MIRQAEVISAFPACGKSYAVDKFANEDSHKHLIMLDSDSSLYSWIYDSNGNRTNIRNPEFPGNYIQHIKDSLNQADYIFVSSHKSVRDAMKEAGIKYTLIYPARSKRDIWLNRCEERGSSQQFIQTLMDNWDTWIDDCENETYCEKKFEINCPICRSPELSNGYEGDMTQHFIDNVADYIVYSRLKNVSMENIEYFGRENDTYLCIPNTKNWSVAELEGKQFNIFLNHHPIPFLPIGYVEFINDDYVIIRIKWFSPKSIIQKDQIDYGYFSKKDVCVSVHSHLI